jgi:hypothetical protein
VPTTFTAETTEFAGKARLAQEIFASSVCSAVVGVGAFFWLTHLTDGRQGLYPDYPPTISQ